MFMFARARDEFEILYDEFEVVAGDSLPQALNTMLDKSETSMMVWSPDYFSESGWAAVEKDGILSKRVREGKRFVPLFLRGKSSIIPTLFNQYVYVDFKEYQRKKDPVEFSDKYTPSNTVELITEQLISRYKSVSIGSVVFKYSRLG